jgi:hypothetical protein
VAVAAVNEGRGRWLLGLGLAGFGLTMFIVVLELLVAQSRLASRIFRLDGETGTVFDRAPPAWSYDGIRQALDLQHLSMTLTTVALLSLTLALIGLRRADQKLALVRIARPIAAPLIGGLLLGVLVDNRSEDLLIGIHEVLGSGVTLYELGECTPYLDDCSRVQALDSVWSLGRLLVIGLTVVMLVPAARAAWHAGAGGQRLGEGWSAAALGCFGLGALAMIATRPYAHDRAVTLAVCETAEYVNRYGWQRDWPRHLANPTSTELHAVRPRECASGLWINDGFQLLDDGTLTEIPFPFSHRRKTVDEWLASDELSTGLDPSQLRVVLEDQLRDSRALAPEEPIQIALYADERTPVAVSREHLQAIRDAGVDEILLLGQATITGELATVGYWRYRVLCPIGRVRFDGATRRLVEFETWADIAAAAESEPLGLAL